MQWRLIVKPSKTGLKHLRAHGEILTYIEVDRNGQDPAHEESHVQDRVSQVPYGSQLHWT